MFRPKNTRRPIKISFTLRLWLICASLFVCFTPSQPLFAQSLIDQRADSDSAFALSPWNWTLRPFPYDPEPYIYGQEFVPSRESIGFVDLWLMRQFDVKNSVTFRVSIREGTIDGPLVGSSAIVRLAGSPPLHTRFHFSPKLSVTPGRKYVIRLHAEGMLYYAGWIIGGAASFSKEYLPGRKVSIPFDPSVDGDLWFRVGPEAPTSTRSIYWQHENGSVARWRLKDVTFLNSRFLNGGEPGPQNSRFAAASDFDGDGQDDFLWQHTNGTLEVSFLNGTNNVGSSVLNTDPMKPTNWKVVGMSDFDGDAKRDILWRNLSGRLKLWLMDGTNFLDSTFLNTPQLPLSQGKILGVGDFNRDSDPDILWQASWGPLNVWFMDKTNYVSEKSIVPWVTANTGWRVTALADFDADEEPDLLWSHADGRQAVWLMNETVRAMVVPLRQGQKTNLKWRVIGAR